MTLLNYVNVYHQKINSKIIIFGRFHSKIACFFSLINVKNIKPLTWWLVLTNIIIHEMLENITWLFKAVASLRCIEHNFLTYNLFNSKIRNKFRVEKSLELVAILNSLDKHCGIKMNR